MLALVVIALAAAAISWASGYYYLQLWGSPEYRAYVRTRRGAAVVRCSCLAALAFSITMSFGTLVLRASGGGP